MESKIATALVVALAFAATQAAPASRAHSPKLPGKSCGDIGFETNTDNVAADIRVVRVTCAKARSIVRTVTLSGDLRPRGYRCTKRADDPRFGLFHYHFTCKNGARAVRWTKF